VESRVGEVAGIIGKLLELARGIEPPTGGLQSNWWGVAEVIEKAGNPSSHLHKHCLFTSSPFTPVHLTSASFVSLSNTYVTPGCWGFRIVGGLLVSPKTKTPTPPPKNGIGSEALGRSKKTEPIFEWLGFIFSVE